MKFLSPVSTLLLAIFLIMGGSGALPAILGTRLNMAGHSAMLIGLIGAAYFTGLTLGSLYLYRIVRQVGHIRAFAAFVSIYSASSLTYAIMDGPSVWLVLRLIDGVCVAGIFICLESWLNDSAEPQHRGVTLAAYMMALYGGQALAQIMLRFPADRPTLPFIVASLVLSVAVVPVAVTRMAAPVLSDQPGFSLRRLYDLSPLGLVGAIVNGAMLGAFYAMAAVQAQRLGFTNADIATFMMTVIAGGICLQWPLGRLSDIFDRRKVIIAGFAMTVAIGAGLGMTESLLPYLVLGFLFGGFSFALYPLCVAHANDRLDSHQRTSASGGLILAYSLGAAGGPLAGSAMMMLAGPGGLYLFIAACAGLVAIFGIWRMAAADRVPEEEQGSFQMLPRTTPVAALLDEPENPL